jgi:hypothetical protein
LSLQVLQVEAEESGRLPVAGRVTTMAGVDVGLLLVKSHHAKFIN